jgi:hypothetical protein
MTNVEFWIACLALIAPAIICIATQRDYWPFSHYPMFSRRMEARDVVVYRLALEGSGGPLTWWRPRVAHVEQRIAAQFSSIAAIPVPSRAQTQARLQFLADIQAIVLADGSAPPDVVALRVVRRQVVSVASGFAPRDETVARIAVARARVGGTSNETPS